MPYTKESLDSTIAIAIGVWLTSMGYNPYVAVGVGWASLYVVPQVTDMVYPMN
jgi:hypothetical protein